MSENTFSFMTAFEFLIDEKREITRNAWKGEQYIVLGAGPAINIIDEGKPDSAKKWEVTQEDIFAKDWYCVVREDEEK